MLALPGGIFTRRINNFSGTPSTTGPGVTVTAGSGVKGSVVTLLSALTFDVQRIMIAFSGYSASTLAPLAVADIVLDYAGGTAWNTTTPFIADLLVGGSAAATAGGSAWYDFPILIPAGASVGCRVRGGGAWAGRVGVWAFGVPRDPSSWWAGDRVITLGVTTASGVSVTPGNTGTYGSWATIGSSADFEIKAMCIGVQSNAGTSVNALAYNLQIGTGSAQIGEELYIATASAETLTVEGPTFQSIGGPAGTSFQARATCSGTAQGLQVALYGVCG